MTQIVIKKSSKRYTGKHSLCPTEVRNLNKTRVINGLFNPLNNYPQWSLAAEITPTRNSSPFNCLPIKNFYKPQHHSQVLMLRFSPWYIYISKGSYHQMKSGYDNSQIIHTNSIQWISCWTSVAGLQLWDSITYRCKNFLEICFKSMHWLNDRLCCCINACWKITLTIK